jgi:hypothetical protein
MSQQVLELIFSSTEAGIEDKAGDKKIIWKDILREGDFAITPGRKQKVPFKVTATGKSSAGDRVISMAELMKSFEDKAFESVTIPLRHPRPGEPDDVLNNSGYVESLRVVKKGGKHYMQAGLGFTEPDIAEKVRRGTIPNVSSGILFDFNRKADDKTFPVALNHVCLTKQPWIDDLEPFKRVYASDDEIADDDIRIDVVDLDDTTSDDSTDKAEIVWNEQASYNWVRTEVQAALSPDEPTDLEVPRMPQPMYSVIDISRDDTALVEEWFRGDRKRWVIPFDLGDNKITISPATRWVEVREAMIAASDDFEKRTYTMLLGRLSVELSENLGEVGKTFVIEEVSTDGRVCIKDTEKDAVFMADFAEFGDRVLLSGTSNWERIKAPVADAAEQPAPAPTPRVVPIHDMGTPEGRVAAARQRRRLLLSSSHKSQ